MRRKPDKANAAASSYAEAVEMQMALRSRLVTSFPGNPVRTVAGADVAFMGKDLAVAGVVLLSWPPLELVDIAIAVRRVDFPYIPGLLSFREIPVLLEAFRRLSRLPDVVFCDGQGRAHPRRFGLACHLGVILGVPTIGCAKSVLVGEYDIPGQTRGSHTALIHKGEEVGNVLRTRDRVEPMYISAGHMMDLGTAVEMALAAGRGFRVPEPTRRAHTLVAETKSLLRKSSP